MKNTFLLISLSLLLVLFPSFVSAQRFVDVEPGVGTLNAAIDGDTTETGERMDSLSTIYRVQRGGFYLLSGSISNSGWPLKIEAAGEGERAILQPAVPSGGESSRPFRPRGDVYLKGLYITNQDELGGLNLRAIRISADNVKVVIDDCHIDKSGQSALRLDNSGMRIFITNSIISNIGQTVDPNNGRAIDDRGNDIDTLVMENNTFYNLTSNILRDGGASVINYFSYNQNTATHIGQRGLELGIVGELSLTNNIFANVGFLGTTEEIESGEFDRKIINLDLVPDSIDLVQNISINNNNFYLDTATVASQYPDSVMAVPIYNEAAMSFVDSTAAASQLSELLSFQAGPSVDSLGSIVLTWYTDLDPGNNTPPLDAGGGGTTLQLPFDFVYGESTASASASLSAGPLGDLNWWDLTPPPAELRIVDVAPGVGTLNEAIDGDTTETGERISPENTLYRLERDGFYLLSGSISNSGYPLRIEAAEGEGERPILQPAVPSGGESSRPFRPRGDITLKGLYITNEDELGGLNLRALRISADSVRVVIDDCHIDKSGQSALRLDNPGMRIFITNSIISNIGQTVDPNNGRAIDDRGNDIDTLFMENNTFYNLTSNILRDGGASVINHFTYNQNTASHIGQRGLDMGVVANLTLTNNVFANVGFFGTTTAIDTSEFDRKILNLDLVPDTVDLTQSVTISNNNFYLDTAAVAGQYPDSVMAVPIYNEAVLSFIDSAAAASQLSEPLEFQAGPSVDSLGSIVLTWYTDPDPGNNTPPLDAGGGGTTDQLPFNFRYQEEAVSATASLDDMQLGDLNWWLGDAPVSVAENLNLTQTIGLTSYPNPFSGTATIRFQLEQREEVRVSLSNAIGQQVLPATERTLGAGLHELGLDASLLPEGMYLLNVQVGEELASLKLVLKK